MRAGRNNKLEKFLKLPRYPFTRAMIEHAPDESGVYGLFYGAELIYVGRTRDGASLKNALLLHQDGARGECTMRATAYTWEISLSPTARESEILARFHQSNRRDPRCQGKAA